MRTNALSQYAHNLCALYRRTPVHQSPAWYRITFGFLKEKGDSWVSFGIGNVFTSYGKAINVWFMSSVVTSLRWYGVGGNGHRRTVWFVGNGNGLLATAQYASPQAVYIICLENDSLCAKVSGSRNEGRCRKDKKERKTTKREERKEDWTFHIV